MVLLLSLLLSSNALASGWFHVDLKPGSVFTESINGTIAITKEAGIYPSENYQCNLKLEGDLSEVSNVVMEGSWKRVVLNKTLAFQDGWDIKNEIIETPDRSSLCLEFGPVYWEEGFPTRDCLKYKESFKTMRNTMVMYGRDALSRRIGLEVICEKWLSMKKLEDIDDFAFLMLKLKSNKPLFWELSLD